VGVAGGAVVALGVADAVAEGSVGGGADAAGSTDEAAGADVEEAAGEADVDVVGLVVGVGFGTHDAPPWCPLDPLPITRVVPGGHDRMTSARTSRSSAPPKPSAIANAPPPINVAIATRRARLRRS